MKTILSSAISILICWNGKPESTEKYIGMISAKNLPSLHITMYDVFKLAKVFFFFFFINELQSQHFVFKIKIMKKGLYGFGIY